MMKGVNKVPELQFDGFGGKWRSYKIGDLTDIKSASRVLKTGVHYKLWVENQVLGRGQSKRNG